MREQQGEEEMMMGMTMANNQQSNSSADRASQQLQQHQMQNSSTLATNSSMPILLVSGSNYLEAGWQGQESNSATVLVQLDGGIPKAGHIMVIVFPFLHH
jgi:hypothetical protein